MTRTGAMKTGMTGMHLVRFIDAEKGKRKARKKKRKRSPQARCKAKEKRRQANQLWQSTSANLFDDEIKNIFFDFI